MKHTVRFRVSDPRFQLAQRVFLTERRGAALERAYAMLRALIREHLRDVQKHARRPRPSLDSSTARTHAG